MNKKAFLNFPFCKNKSCLGNLLNIKLSKFLLVLTLILFSGQLNAQEEFTVSGYVRNASSGEALIGVTVFVDGLKAGSRSNSYGFYSLTLPQGKYKINYRYIGYNLFKLDIDLNKSVKQNIDLSEQSIQTNEIVVTAKRGDENIKSAEIGVAQISPSEIRSIPVIFGEQDILKSLQLLPGISATSEANSGFVVRGGSPDQNLILLDEATVYNASHLLGFFSVFNPDAIKDVKIYKGTAPARYGGRLSSILDIKICPEWWYRFDFISTFI